MARSALTTRDRGFALVGRLNRWLVAGAVALSGGLSIAAANAFHGHTRGQSASASNAVTRHSASGGSNSSSGDDSNEAGENSASGDDSNESGENSSGGGGSSVDGGGLQPPAQAPTPAPAPPSGGVVSGGS